MNIYKIRIPWEKSNGNQQIFLCRFSHDYDRASGTRGQNRNLLSWQVLISDNGTKLNWFSIFMKIMFILSNF